MAILTCPGCGRGGLRIPDGRPGKVTCPSCGAEWFYPEPKDKVDAEFDDADDDGSSSRIKDPGKEFAYLVVELRNGKELFVRKDCRVKRFDPHWETEPVPEDFKPDLTIFASNIPHDLWKLLNAEEKLLSLLAESKSEAGRFKRQRNNLVATVVLIAWLFVIVLAFQFQSHF